MNNDAEEEIGRRRFRDAKDLRAVEESDFNDFECSDGDEFSALPDPTFPVDFVDHGLLKYPSYEIDWAAILS